jgi:hypothetical protein
MPRRAAHASKWTRLFACALGEGGFLSACAPFEVYEL